MGAFAKAGSQAQRAKIVLLAAEGLKSKGIARRLKADPGTVGRRRLRFAKGGLEPSVPKASGRIRRAGVTKGGKSSVENELRRENLSTSSHLTF
ncbi:MAG: helix-turn-helix domain-containing protein [Planctomycetaceae bacterium]